MFKYISAAFITWIVYLLLSQVYRISSAQNSAIMRSVLHRADWEMPQ